MIEIIRFLFRKPIEETINKVPEGLRPGSWGRQEYDGLVRKLYQEKQIDVNNHKAKHAFIQKFMVKYINGIQLKREM
jgi:hypothetical protein